MIVIARILALKNMYDCKTKIVSQHRLLCTKGQIISKGLLVSSNSPKKQTNEFVFTTTTNSFVRFLGKFEDTKKSFRNYLTFKGQLDSKGLFGALNSSKKRTKTS